MLHKIVSYIKSIRLITIIRFLLFVAAFCFATAAVNYMTNNQAVINPDGTLSIVPDHRVHLFRTASIICYGIWIILGIVARRIDRNK